MPPVPFSKFCGADAMSCAFCDRSFRTSGVDINVTTCLEAVSNNAGLQCPAILVCKGCWPDVQSLMARKRQSEHAPSPKKACQDGEADEPSPKRSRQEDGMSCAFCDRSFRTSVVDINVTTCLEAGSSNTGLQCPAILVCKGCWPDVQSLMARKRQSEHAPSPKRACQDGKADAPSLKRARQEDETGPEKTLPAEIWELIFLAVDPSQLLRIRQTCRYWRDIVDGSNALLDKLTVHFPSGIQMDQHYQPPEHLRPATRAAWRSSGAHTKLICVDAWWPTFGLKLTHLNMEFTEVSLATLLDMLRCTPNLQNFSSGSITDESSDAAGDVGFRLGKIESLRVQKTPGTVVEKLAEICPRVKSFRVDYLDRTRAEDEKIFRSIRTLQSSLEELVLVGHDPFFIDDLCKLKHLKLKKISLNIAYDGDDVLEFCHLQPDLELFDVVVYGTHEELCEIGQSCPKLKSIDASISQKEGAVPTFLNTMSKLERLKLSAMTYIDPEIYEDFSDPDPNVDILVKFDGLKNEHLRELLLNCMKPDTTSLQCYIKQCPKLTSLQLDRCPVENFEDLLAVFQAVESLEYVKLSGVKIGRSRLAESPVGRMNSLKRLEISQCRLKKDEIDYLLSLCPMLEELTLRSQQELTLNHKLGSLKKLDFRLSVCSPRTIFSIVFYCRSLKELLVSDGWLSEDCRDVLEKQFGPNLSLIVG